MKKQTVIFTDIDGTLIDFDTYAYDVAAPMVAQLRRRGIPVVLCSSKTRAEQEFYRRALAIPDPFIVENGGAIFIPRGYFGRDVGVTRTTAVFAVIELGVNAAAIREILTAIRQETGLAFRGYGDISADELAQIIGLDPAAAARAQAREYSETIITPLDADAQAHLNARLAARGLTLVSGGKFHTIMAARSDKGTAVSRLSELFRQKFGPISTIGLGDSANDRPLLAAVDRPFLVQKPGGKWQKMGALVVNRVEGVGPAGWRQVMAQLLAAGA